MTGRFLRVLTPLGWLATMLLLVAVLIVVGRGLGLRWDPLQLQARRLEAAEQRLGRAKAEAGVRAQEAAARGRQIESLDAFHQNNRAVTAAAVAAEIRARNADDADTPLDADRAGRLRDHDRELCRLAPAVAGCAAATDAG
ncbi:hypothetical protein [Brevundimonas diminuta]|uniref:hypothetical protein n=1 Tax=Brevundimonas diminuta TaxID=293 RepID=UPI003D026B59